ncbi:MAG TPA: thioesterase family protein [Gemmatimonadaceae bacterium]
MPDQSGRSRDDPFTLRRTVEPGHLDENRHVNNVVYLQWVQDAAIAHWRTIAPASALAEIAWVARRHEIDYDRPAKLGDELTLATWVGRAEGLTFERFVEIRQADGRVAARARTLWVPVDPGSGRPKRVGAEVRELFSV